MFKLTIGTARRNEPERGINAPELRHLANILAKCEQIIFAGHPVHYEDTPGKFERVYWAIFASEEEAVLFKLTHM